MRLEHHPIRVSHETIHRFAYSTDGRDEQFYRHSSTSKACHTGLSAPAAVPLVMRNEDRQSKPFKELIQGLAPCPLMHASPSPWTAAPNSLLLAASQG
ncbi:hypothetical protein [Roseovarius sp. MMSF_3281]|uniref:hypothetical protein n=1 Tax=Roseovarius sp. MMSF_3281 TaxID=3046694 RepID=UPI003531DC55